MALVEPDWVGKLSGFTLLFEALVLMLAQQMTFAAVARIVGETWHRVHAICSRYVDLALTHADLSAVDTVAIDETSYKRGHNYLTLAADADARKVVFVTEGRDADAVAGFAAHLRAHKADPQNITCVSIDMSPAFIKGVTDNLSNARITFDKFHVIAHASQAVDKMRRVEQRTDPALKGLRWALLKDRSKLSATRSWTLIGWSQLHNQAHGACMALPRTIARHPRSQANQRRNRHARSVVHQRYALQGRAHEGGRRNDP